MGLKRYEPRIRERKKIKRKQAETIIQIKALYVFKFNPRDGMTLLVQIRLRSHELHSRPRSLFYFWLITIIQIHHYPDPRVLFLAVL